MSATVTLTLDTAGPEVTWGAQTGTTAGELLQLAYAADETIAGAELVAGGQSYQMVVGSSILSVQLPFDVADGPADVVVVDDVGNHRAYLALVTLHGTVVVVPAPVQVARGGLPRPQRPRRGRRIQTHVTVLARTECRVRADVAHHVGYAGSCTASVRARLERRPTPTPETAILRLQSRLRGRGDELTCDVAVAIHRRDGPDLEEMILLGLL